MTEEEIQEAKERSEEWDAEEMIDNADHVLEEADENGSSSPYDPTDEF